MHSPWQHGGPPVGRGGVRSHVSPAHSALAWQSFCGMHTSGVHTGD
ncbi:MAG TPA: hypothetical protein RMH99_17330 [Sandaracinaceae bacterium LLY-WYZ-13_1]|nr:hypothetical protein [Sandaracinaceae bacterium LLY-WYZ-13_1]